MLDNITAYFSSLSPACFYIGLFLSAYIENIFPPVPGDTVTVFAAYIVGRSEQKFAGVFIATTLGSVAGFMTYYGIGRLVHPDYFIRRNFRFLPASSIENAGKWFRQYGNWVILLNRFLSGIRSVISIVCGLYRMPWLTVLILCVIGCSFWNLLLMWAGYLLGSNWKMIDRMFFEYNRILLVAIIVTGIAVIVRRKILAARSRN